MAIKGKVTTKFGEERELYFRINHAPEVTYDGITEISVLLRGYVDNFENGKLYMWSSDEVKDLTLDNDYTLSLKYPQSSIDLNGNVRAQVYELMKKDPKLLAHISNIVDA